MFRLEAGGGISVKVCSAAATPSLCCLDTQKAPLLCFNSCEGEREVSILAEHVGLVSQVLLSRGEVSISSLLVAAQRRDLRLEK